MSCDSQVAEVVLSLSDFNPVAKTAPNPDLLCEMMRGAPTGNDQKRFRVSEPRGGRWGRERL